MRGRMVGKLATRPELVSWGVLRRAWAGPELHAAEGASASALLLAGRTANCPDCKATLWTMHYRSLLEHTSAHRRASCAPQSRSAHRQRPYALRHHRPAAASAPGLPTAQPRARTADCSLLGPQGRTCFAPSCPQMAGICASDTAPTEARPARDAAQRAFNAGPGPSCRCAARFRACAAPSTACLHRTGMCTSRQVRRPADCRCQRSDSAATCCTGRPPSASTRPASRPTHRASCCCRRPQLR